MPRFFCEHFNENTVITGDDGRHISRSLRMKVGDELTVCDTAGTDYTCRISEICDTDVHLQIIESHKNTSEPTVFVTLYQCMPKGDKLDMIVQKAVELGVSRIVPVISEHCVSRPDNKAFKKRRERLQKIANEAAKQSGRGILPTVEDKISYTKACEELKDYDKSIIFYELGGAPTSDIVDKSLKKLALIIGPEGGFSVLEVEKATIGGAVTATLGKRILRTETAPLAALSVTMLLSGNME